MLELTNIPARYYGDWIIRSDALIARLLDDFTKPKVRILGFDLAGTIKLNTSASQDPN